jgi:macrolide-specific efflux system membrane fusion protein
MKKFWIAIGILALGLIIYFSYSYFKTISNRPTMKEILISKGEIDIKILATGTVQPANRLEIKSPVAGRVDRVLVHEGQKVSKGQILAWMSSSERAALLDSARAQGLDELKKWEDMYKPTPIVAPLTGTIILKNVEDGQTFTTNDAVLVMSNRLTLKAQVDETDLSQIKLNQLCDLRLDAYPEIQIKAHVDRIAYEAKTVSNVTTYTVEVLPEETPEFMRSGMTANLTFFVETKKNILVLPTEFIKYEEGKPYVLIKSENSKPIQKEITLGVSDGKQTEVLSGANTNDVVIMILNNGKDKKSGSPFSPFGGNKPKSGNGNRNSSH